MCVVVANLRLWIYKSCLLEQGVANEQIISINFEDYDYIDLLEPRNFYAYVKESICLMDA